MENFIEGPIALEVKNVKLHKFRNTSKALICCLLKTQIKHTLMKRSVSSEMLQKTTALGKKQIRAKLVPFHRKKNPTDIGLVKILSTENFSPLPHPLFLVNSLKRSLLLTNMLRT